MGWLISGVAVVTRTPQLFKIIRAESVRGIEPSLYEVRSCALPLRGWHCGCPSGSAWQWRHTGLG